MTWVQQLTLALLARGMDTGHNATARALGRRGLAALGADGRTRITPVGKAEVARLVMVKP
jgi:hypothetical protein